ncbi:putative mannan endo-1,4-beta-mannosidase A [Talaromyces islandicus]|uniref:mannan endo-1,4-beta-mannosidase n=1 Tax=Talaromyces islandicus TaxID=28573 RepID=A0A0U1LYU5_TALIS|nr:putative mannan endo-1,4-beta-mannosidase A [Talaromyces islandicus]
MKTTTILSTAGFVFSQVASYAMGFPTLNPYKRSNSTFPGTSGLQFTIDGTAGYFAGSNAYWLGFQTNNDDVDKVLADAEKSGLRIMRIWGFNDVNSVPTDGSVYYQLLENGKATINTGKDGLQRLDYVVSSAERHNIKLIINFVNYWSDYGGMAAYVAAFGGSTTSWYTDDASQAAYQNYIKTVVSRYIDSPAVFAWELANEPRCSSCDVSVIHDWVASTSAFIKSIDSAHLVGIGDEGFGLDINSDGSYPYGYSEGSNFTLNLGVDTIDFGTFHLYPSNWGTSNSFGSPWVTAHGAACAAAGKPCLFEEYGVYSDKCTVEGGWQKTALNTKGIGADTFWQFGDTLSSGNSPNDKYTVYYGTDDYTCLVDDHVAAL